MVKRIVVLCDGTGNSVAKIWRTNVWRTYDRLDLTGSDQVAYYNDGIGSSQFKPIALLAGVFGVGLKRNVVECYEFICRNYEPGGELFLFGFSRGAYTIRVLLEVIARVGLVAYDGNEQKLRQSARAAFRHYRSELHTISRIESVFRFVRDFFLPDPTLLLANRMVPSIRFVGLWDTVSAYGLPFEEMTRAFSAWVYPLQLASPRLPTEVVRACHALSLDDERTTFHPRLFLERDNKPLVDGEAARTIDRERISQVWFPGVHSNVGGGYPDDTLSLVSLDWMLSEAAKCGLRFRDLTSELRVPEGNREVYGRMYDSRSGLATYYRYGPRDLTELYSAIASDEKPAPKIHFSVFERLRAQVHPYSPIGIPENYYVVTRSGELLQGNENPFETPDQAQARFEHQQILWNIVWRRRVAYYGIILVTASFFFMPLFVFTPPSVEFSTPLRWLSDLIRIISALVPFDAHIWVDAYARNPSFFVMGLYLLSSLVWISDRSQATISDGMRALWKDSLAGRLRRPTRNWPYTLRTNKWLRAIREGFVRRWFPTWVLVLVVYLGIMFVAHLLFIIVDASGSFCHEKPKPSKISEVENKEWSGVFSAKQMCWGTGVLLERNMRYTITIKQLDDWRNGSIPASINGYHVSDIESLTDRTLLSYAILLRRTISRPYFRITFRVGAVGSEEYFLTPTAPQSKVIESTLRPQRDGELFIYVNDLVLFIPGLSDFFYRDNEGSALITISSH